MKIKKLVSISLAVGIFVFSLPSTAINANHKVLGIVDFGKTTIPEVAKSLEGKCERIGNSKDVYGTIAFENCFSELDNIENFKNLILNTTNKESKTVTSVFFYAKDNTNIVGSIKILTLFMEEERNHINDVFRVYQEILNDKYGIRTIDEIWRTDDYTVDCILMPKGEIINGKVQETSSIEVNYKSRHPIRIENYLNDPEYIFNNPSDRERFLEISKEMKKLKELF